MEFHIENPLILHLYHFAIAIVLGGLIGLERQFSKTEIQEGVVGVRTFIFVTLFGALSALVSAEHISWFFAVAFAAMAGMVCVRYVMIARCGELGVTTEITMILAFLIGAITYWGHLRLAIALGVGVTMLLSLKTEFHRWTERMSSEDIWALLKFAIITFVVLPILPNRTVDPWGLFNPYEVWIMVVLIAGVSFAGYVLLKFMRGGVEWIGAIGGLISSTATTVSFSRHSKSSVWLVPHLAMGVLLACTVMFPRLLVIIGVAGPSLAPPLVLPFSLMTVTGVVAGLLWWRRYREVGYKSDEGFQFENPVELSSALTFGLIFAIIRIISILAERYWGHSGLYIVSGLSGVAELDAIVLSISRMVRETGPDAINVATGVRAVLIACVSNTLIKAGIVVALARRGMKMPVVAGLVAMAVVGALYLVAI